MPAWANTGLGFVFFASTLGSYKIVFGFLILTFLFVCVNEKRKFELVMPLSIHPVFLMENEEYSRGNPGGLAYTGCWDDDSRQPTVLASCLGAAPDPEVTKLVTHPLCLWICTRPLCLSKLKSLARSSSQVLLAGVSLKGECLGCAADRFHREMLIWAALWADLVKQRLE